MRWKRKPAEKHTMWFAWRPITTKSGYRVWWEWVRRDRLSNAFQTWYEYELDPATTPWRN